MRPKLTSLIALTMIAFTLALACGPRVYAGDIEATLDDQKASLDKQNRLHLEATADINAPAAKVYEALINPDKVAKYDARVTSVKVVSHDTTTKVVEFKGETLPIPNMPPALRVKYTFNPPKKEVKSESVGKAPVQFQTETTVAPSKDGKGAVVSYSSVSTSAGKVMGMEPPMFMRQQFALESFMRQMHNVAEYVQHGGK
jgi:uncharacterized protein YndB with AHSA1/START domain